MSTSPPRICGTLLVAMAAAGFGHYWSVREFVSRYPTAPASRIVPAISGEPAALEKMPASPLAESSGPGENNARREFFEELLAEVRALRNENKNLIDQVAETNRDMMKMEFRLDTHSESFRPLPTSEEREDTSNYIGDIPSGFDGDLPSVLPPRATPVSPLED
jgi:hypothetical protein